MNAWKDIQHASLALERGHLVAIPTETVYGLAAMITNEQALKKIFEIKKRPYFDPLIVHIADSNMARELSALWPPLAESLSQAYWPGPLTLVVPKNEKRVSPLITSGLPSVGLRVPRHPYTRRLIRNLGVALAAPSANIFGSTSPTEAPHIRQNFSTHEVYTLDGGPCQIGLESSVVEIVSDRRINILRPGFITQEKMKEFFEKQGMDVEIEFASGRSSPGQLEAHYQPKIPLVLIAQSNMPITPALDTSIREKLGISIKEPAKELALDSNPYLSARSLYADLYRLSATPAAYLYIVKPDKEIKGEWIAIWDRIQRASSLKFV